MKKLFLYLLLSVAATSMAAPPIFDVTAPNWTKIAISKGENVNIRKSPSSTAPRLVYDEAKIDDYDIMLTYYAYWSTMKPVGSVHALSFDRGSVVSERNGWLEIKNIGPKEAENGWVSAKFCDVKPIEAITPSTFTNSDSFRLVKQGDGSKGSYGIFMETNEMEGTVDFYYGRFVNGFIVMPYHLQCVMYYDGSQRPGITYRDGSCLFVFGKSMSGDIEGVPDMRKITPAILNSIIKNAKSCTPAILYKCGDETLFTTNN